jgi:hypothetical protein
MNDACFIVRDANGQALAYVYFENEPRRRARRRSCPDEAPRGTLRLANASLRKSQSRKPGNRRRPLAEL